MFKNVNLFLALHLAYLYDLFSKLRSNKESFNNIVHLKAINRGQYGLISTKKRFNVNISDYK